MNKAILTIKRILAAAVMCMALFLIVPVNSDAVVTSSGAIAKGIDVSKYQGTINWAQVAASGVKFAFIRIGTTYGGTPNLDPTFAYNVQQAQANGIQVGVYMYSYATNVEMATVEAMLTIQWLEALNVGLQLPVVYDVEDKCHTKMSTVDLYNMINTYCILIDNAGYTPMVYTYKNFYTGKLGTSPWDKWMAQYGDSLNTSETVAFWQYSSSGSVPGIGTRVDMNYQYKDYSSIIIPEGFVAHGTGTRFYSGYKMQRGWIVYQGAKYYADSLGYIQKGWYLDTDGRMYFLDMNTGAASVGLVSISNFSFYFDESGAQKTGYIDYGAGQKYFDPTMNGAMATSWYYYNGQLHYADKDGNQAIGLVEIDKNKYFFNEDGSLVIGTTIDVLGTQYVANEMGILTEVPQEPLEGGYIEPSTGLMLDEAGNWVNPTTGQVAIGVDGTVNFEAFPNNSAAATTNSAAN